MGGDYDRPICSDDRHVNRYELKQSQEIAAKESEIALLKANNFTDTKILDAYKDLLGQLNSLKENVYDNTCKQAVTNQRLTDNISFVDSKFDGVYKDIATSQRETRNYIDSELCHYVRGKVVMPLDAICPAAMPACEPKTSK